MIPRTLEPEVMDLPDDAREYDSMDHREVNQAFTKDFLDKRDPEDGFLVLDVGTGTAQIPIVICQHDPRFIIHALDLAKSMLDIANQNIQATSFQNQIITILQDAKKLSFPDNHFDAVISNSIIHHIPEPTLVFSEMVRVTKPGGLLFVRDLMRPPIEPAVARLVKLHAAQATAYQQKLFGDSLRAALTEQEVRNMVGELGFGKETVRQSSDRHWTWIARKRIP